MKKFFHTVYLLGISVILFGCLLAVSKDFNILHLMKTPIGIVVLIVMFLSTFLVMYFSSDKQSDEETTDSTGNYHFKKYEIKKQIIDEFLLGLINKNDDAKEITYVLNKDLLTVNIHIKKINDVNVIQLVEELRKDIESKLNEKFGIKGELKLKFNVVEEKKKEEVKVVKEEEKKADPKGDSSSIKGVNDSE
ncbi:hypothetical protein [Priestia aryabhattai]